MANDVNTQKCGLPEFVTHKAEDGSLWAEVPSMPGCFAAGIDEKELRECLTEAVELWRTRDRLREGGAD